MPKQWQLSCTLHTGRRGRPFKHSGMYESKDSARKSLANIIRAWGGNMVFDIVLTNTKESYHV